ncbi:MAG: hypothetical protein C4521_01545 [Actinobacteria bacterium]|nr:MAG: hypothetical protein C4521_01545 [Actinomycetota bacterium]
MPKFEHKIAELILERSKGSAKIIRTSSKGVKTLARIESADDGEVGEFWLQQQEEWLNTVGRYGWELVQAEHVESGNRFYLKRQVGKQAAAGDEKEEKQPKSMTEDLMKKAAKSILPF